MRSWFPRFLTGLVAFSLLTGFSGPLPPKAPPPLGPESALITLGPDEYGYMLDDTVSIPFEDITGTGSLQVFADNDDWNAVSTVSFPYYSQAPVTTAYVSVNGFVSLDPITDADLSAVNKPFPTDSWPNSLIAPFWYDLIIDVIGGVYVESPSTGAPRTIIQWDNVKFAAANIFVTFEIILYDSGNIAFVYQPANPISADLSLVTAGIEDPDGATGLNYSLGSLATGRAVLISRPPAGAHLKARPHVNAAFLEDGETWFSIDVTNETDSSLPLDTYLISSSLLDAGPPAYPWSIDFYDATCTTPLPVDALTVSKGVTTTLCIRLMAGGAEIAGAYARYQVTLTSIANPALSSNVHLQAGIGEPFIQLYQDSNAGLELDVTQPDGRQGYEADLPYDGSHMAMNLLWPGTYIVSWLEDSDIKFRLFKSYTGGFGPLHQLPASADDARNPIDLSPAVAASRDQFIGFLYLVNQYQVNGTTGHLEVNSNVYFSMLDPDGDLLPGYPRNMTGNGGWLDLAIGNPSASGTPQYFHPQVTGVGPDGFGLVWRTNLFRSDAANLDKIDYVILKTDGSDPSYYEIPGWDDLNRHVYPAAGSLADGRLVIGFANYTGASNPWTIHYTVIDPADGSPDVGVTAIPGSDGSQIDLAQLAGGELCFTWIRNTTSSVRFAIISADLTTLAVAPTTLSYEDFPGHPNYRSAGYPSVSPAGDGGAIITWEDADWQEQLYYTVVDPSGGLTTAPMLFRRVGSSQPASQLSTNGYGNAQLSQATRFMPVIMHDYSTFLHYFLSLVLK